MQYGGSQFPLNLKRSLLQSSAVALLALGLQLGGCALDSNPEHKSGTEMWDAKIPRSLHDALAAGDERDVLALLDEAEVENSTNAAPDAAVGTLTGPGVAVQRAALMASPQAPGSDMFEAGVQARADLYRAGWERVLAAVDAHDVQPKQRYQHVPLLFAHVRSLAGLEALAARKEVARIYEDETYEASLTESLPLINQPAAAAAGKRQRDHRGRDRHRLRLYELGVRQLPHPGRSRLQGRVRRGHGTR